MSDLKDKILKIYPAAQFEDGQDLLFSVEEKDWLKVATLLKNDLGFDVLSAVVGMDWKENRSDLLPHGYCPQLGDGVGEGARCQER